MKMLITYEWIHFSRNTARPVSVLLFIFAACAGLYNGLSIYKDRTVQIDAVKQSMKESHDMAVEWFNSGNVGPADRPWVDVNEPYWAMRYANHHVIDHPSPNMIYNVGQSEHFGYYKRVSMWTTAMDDDLTAEIANPEMIQMGALDFSFVWLYLMPLLLIVLTFQVKGLEYDLGFLPLLKIQNPSLNRWSAKRLSVIGLGLWLILTLFIWMPVLAFPHSQPGSDVVMIWLVYSLYLILWLLLVYIVLVFGKGQADQALKMTGIWLLLTIVIPGTVNQYIILNRPTDLMLTMIEARRDGEQAIFDLPTNEIKKNVFELMPELKETAPAKNDTLLTQPMINGAYRLVLNDYMSSVTNKILNDQIERNKLIASSYWFNPVVGFHNWLNRLTHTSHEDNLIFRSRIQEAGKAINESLIRDEWNSRKMDKMSFMEYADMFEIQ